MQERRRHRMYLTKNTEYHFRDTECVGVRDRATGQWYRKHLALRSHMAGCLDKEKRVWQVPRRGGRLQLISRRGLVLTSPVLEHDRPTPQAIFAYTSLVQSGCIETP